MTEKQTEYKPEWVQKLEDWGNRQDKKLNKKPVWERKGEFIGSVFGNIIAAVAVTYAPKLFPNFFTPAYSAVLSVMLAVIFATIIGNLVLTAYSPKWFYFILQSMLHGLCVISMITMLTIFPFNMPNGLDLLVKFGITVGAVVVSIIGIIYFIRGVIAVIFSD